MVRYSIEYIVIEEMGGLECMDGGITWNLMLYTRVLLKARGVG